MRIDKRYIPFLLMLVMMFTSFSCANRGQGPQGGPKDETPPKPLRSTPENKTINFTNNKIEILFDENISLKDIANNVIISPPQRSNPEIRSYAKKLSVVLNDTLKENTTYSIDFGNAIVDNNEGNILKNYVFSFSTGSEIDTMQISGTLINAEDLNPIEGVIVGIHSDLSDTAFLKKPFDRITRSSDEGRFTVHNVKVDSFKVYALEDVNRDNIFQTGEGAAFNSEVFKTRLETYTRADTLMLDSLTIDTIKHTEAVRLLPDDVLLKFFKDPVKRQYIVKSERPAAHQLSLFFNTENEKLPEISAIDAPWEGNQLLQVNNTLDSLTFWLTDSTLIKQDTIHLAVNYMKSDSVMRLQAQTDTIRFLMRRAAAAKATVKSTGKKEFLRINSNAGSRFDSYKAVELTFTSPVATIDTSAIQLNQKVDTLYHSRDFTLEKADSAGMKFLIHHSWTPEEQYQLLIDSAAITDIYGLHNNETKNDLSIRSLEDYSKLIVSLAHFDSATVIQVLDKSDKVVRTVPAKTNPVEIEFLNPGEYYLRMFIDRNRNGRWDPGNVRENLPPEEVFYYSKKLNLIKNWEYEESWDHTLVPLLEQKPEELRKSINTKK